MDSHDILYEISKDQLLVGDGYQLIEQIAGAWYDVIAYIIAYTVVSQKKEKALLTESTQSVTFSPCLYGKFEVTER